jgi:hypothetical protein
MAVVNHAYENKRTMEFTTKKKIDHGIYDQGTENSSRALKCLKNCASKVQAMSNEKCARKVQPMSNEKCASKVQPMSNEQMC